jgi:translocation and assembly module TamA
MHFTVKITAFFLLLSAATVKASESEISIQGLTEQQEKNVRAFLSLSMEQCDAPAWRIKNLYSKTDSEIAKALRALGYYQPKIIKQLTFSDDCWHSHFDISAGDPVRINGLIVQVQGEAKQDPAFKKLLASLPIKLGDVLNHALYEKIKQDLRSLALEYGYLNHQLIKKILRVNPEKKQAEIELIMNSGARHRFGSVEIDQDILDPDFVRRYIAIDADEYYSSKKLAKTYNALTTSNYFSSVEVKPMIEDIADNNVPIHITLLPQKKHDFNFGIGFDTDIGPLGSIGYQNRRINREGHHFSFDLDISPVLSSVESRYVIPFSEPRSDYVSIGTGYKYEKPDTFESQEAKLSFHYHHLYQNGWKQTLFLDLSYESSTISNESQNTLLLVPGGRWQFTESNHPLRPTKGYHLDFSLASSPESVISDVTFVQATLAGKLISPLPWSARFIVRAKLGATLVSDFDRLPASYRFYAGGIETIRGYDYKELGPKDNDNNVIGGRMLSVVSAEYEQFITESWGVAVFIDAGNAYNTNNINIKSGAGLGVRWVSPIGPIRLDFAVPLQESDSSFQIHFAAGIQL